jgi:hypothetical protein
MPHFLVLLSANPIRASETRRLHRLTSTHESPTIKPGRPSAISDTFQSFLCNCRSGGRGRRRACPICNAPAICQPLPLEGSLRSCARAGRLPRVVGEYGAEMGFYSWPTLRLNIRLRELNRDLVPHRSQTTSPSGDEENNLNWNGARASSGSARGRPHINAHLHTSLV